MTDLVERLADVHRRAAAVAGDDRGHSHAQEILRPRLLRQIVRMGVDVDEPRRHDQAGGVDGPLRCGFLEIADPRDAAVPDRHVGVKGPRAGAVDHGAVADEEVVGGGGRRDGKDEKDGKDGHG